MRRPCLDCGGLTTSGSRCVGCERDKRRRRPWYNTAWRKLSRAVRAEHPFCADCGATTDLTVDHVFPRSLDGGVRVLCRSCNSKKNRRPA